MLIELLCLWGMATAQTCDQYLTSISKTVSSSQFLQMQVSNIVKRIENRPIESPIEKQRLNLDLPATRNGLTDWLYDNGVVEHSDLTLLFSDKLIMAKLLQHYLKARSAEFHPFVMGLKEFLEKAQLLDSSGKVKASTDQIKRAFAQYFPEGFILKPPVSWATDGKGFYTKEDEVAALLAGNDSKLYEAEKEFNTPLKSPLATMVTSGERWMVMGKIKNTSITGNKLYGRDSEFRVHTFHHHLVPDATLHRYGLSESPDRYPIVNEFVEKLLAQLPRALTHNQAWGLDVFIQSDGRPTLIEVNTNRGERTNWSDFLRGPDVLAGYTKFFEQEYGWHINGVEGRLMKYGLGNLRSHLKHELPYYLEMVAEAKEAKDREIILNDLKETATHYKNRFNALIVTVEEQGNKDYQTTLTVSHKFYDLIYKVNEIGDPAWNDFVQWFQSL